MLLTVLSLAIGAVHAENGAFYVGAGVSHSDVSNNDYLFYTADQKATSWKAFAGVRPLKWLAVEADYIDLGSSNITFTQQTGGPTLPGSEQAGGSEYAGYLVGFLPIPWSMVDIYGKAGVSHWTLNFNEPPPTVLPPYSIHGTDFAWGVGVQAHITMFGARLEYENFNIPQTSGARIVSLSVFLNLNL
jgi:hypothetical protein